MIPIYTNTLFDAMVSCADIVSPTSGNLRGSRASQSTLGDLVQQVKKSE